MGEVRRSRSGQRILQVLVILAALVSLTGCDPYQNLQGPTAIRFGASGLEIAVCRASEVHAVLIIVDDADGGTSTWEAAGASAFEVGDVLTESDLLLRFPGATIEELPASPTAVQIVLESSSPGGNIVAAIPLDRTPPSADAWLRPDGQYYETPCDTSL